jgi:AraC family transcriptional regulator of adaptative response/methylated-DNA-[protein]-cysteine methyltransferase
MSPYYLQRVFKRLVGLTPKEYHDARKIERLKRSLKRGETVTNATYEAGFSSSSRLYERVNSNLGMPPSVFRSGASGVTLCFTTMPTVIGRMLVAVTERGIATLRFGDTEKALVDSLRQDYPKAFLRRDAHRLKPYVSGILQCLTGNKTASRLSLDLTGTAFQQRVWKALQQIPSGTRRSYRDVAREIDQPTAVRAVARACATNPVALLVPCHRVTRHDGGLGGYRWGLHRKRRLLALERKRRRAQPLKVIRQPGKPH